MMGELRQLVDTVLVVEDDVLVRFSVADYLRGCGYKVLEAGSAAEAITVLNTDMDVDLVFSDIQMPGEIDGFGLARWIRQNRPSVKVMLTSGYAKAAEIAADLCDGGPLMSKPYDEQLVVDRIKRLLGGRDRARTTGAA